MANTISREEVEKIQKIINEDQKKHIQIKTRMDSDYEFVENKYGLKTLDEIEDKLDEIEANKEKTNKEIDEKGKALKEAYPWDL